jgi:hypothetical protein
VKENDFFLNGKKGKIPDLKIMDEERKIRILV